MQRMLGQKVLAAGLEQSGRALAFRVLRRLDRLDRLVRAQFVHATLVGRCDA
ncbi:hypothetical protein LP420_30640 [Massilia sp. B-10]|nr:hypothetical protein LP420_30640 [Massilia sp. B-10]